MLHDFSVELIEAVGAVAIAIVMAGDLVESSTPCVVGGGAPVERRRDRCEQERGIDANPRSGLGREDVIDRSQGTGRILDRVVLVRERRRQQQPPLRPQDEVTAQGCLLHAIRGVDVSGTLDPQSVIGHPRRVAPQCCSAKIQVAGEVPWRYRRCLDQLVSLRGIQPGHVPLRAIAGEVAIPAAQREPSAAVDAVEVRIEARWLLDERLTHAQQEVLAPVRHVRREARRLLGLFDGDGPRARLLGGRCC